MSEMQPASVKPPPTEGDIRTWNMLCHLSSLAGLVIPGGNVIGPLLVWQIKKHDIPSLDGHGKASVNFQLTVLIATLVAGLLAFVTSFFCIGFLLIPVAIAIPIAGIVLAVIAGIKANDGQEYRYPCTIELIK
jgi:uncharacterized Tic20 family protein